MLSIALFGPRSTRRTDISRAMNKEAKKHENLTVVKESDFKTAGIYKNFLQEILDKARSLVKP